MSPRRPSARTGEPVASSSTPADGRADRDADARERRRIDRLVAWFESARRDLPWRRLRNGYTALVAEAMLQQTQVSRVVERFDAFIARFPTVRDLAAADEQEVLALWQGLGYYRRARSLHAAARHVVERLDGAVPADAAALRGLPGVGPYTAGAIASIVHGAAEPLVDGNVQRVLARWYDDDRQPRDRAAAADAWSRAAELVRLAPRPGVLNEALMELGALICTPRSPRCDACPVSASCLAKRRDRQHVVPPPRTAAARRTVHHHAVVIARAGRVLLEQRPDGGLWSRLWQPPAVESDDRLEPDDVAAALAERRVPTREIAHRRSFTHTTTHRLVEFHVHVARSTARGGDWIAADALAELPMSSAHRRVLRAADQGQ